MPNNEWYSITDRAIALLNRRAATRFGETKNQAQIDGFDELEVIQLNRTLYDDLKRDNQEVFLDLAQEKYAETEPHGEEPPSLAWLLALLAAYNAVTKYVYDNEIDRKRDRTTEAVNSTTAKATEYRRGLSYWSQMTAQYADTVTDEAALQAYLDAGVSRVRWVTAEDDKVCETCRSRDGKVYSIDNIPDKPHWRCRCYWVPAGGTDGDTD